MDFIENRTFEQIETGQTAELTRVLALDDVKLFSIAGS